MSRLYCELPSLSSVMEVRLSGTLFSGVSFESHAVALTPLRISPRSIFPIIFIFSAAVNIFFLRQCALCSAS